MKKEKGIFEQDGISYDYFKCPKCKEELMDMNQLGKTADKYRKLKDAQKTKISRWGNSLAIRISKEFVDALNLKDGDQVLLVKENKTLKILV